MVLDISPTAAIHFQFLIAHPWIGAALDGALIGIGGAALFIGASWLFRAVSERRRTRRALALVSDFNETQPPELDDSGQDRIPSPPEVKDNLEAARPGRRRVSTNSQRTNGKDSPGWTPH